MAKPNKRADTRVDTIFALSSGVPPAAIAIIRMSGPNAGQILQAVAGSLPPARVATVRTLTDRSGQTLDKALVLWFPGPGSATGEDLAELHVHGGRAVVDAVSHDLAHRGVRPAEPGEFTRRALFNGRLAVSEVEGLADLLAAETDAQRREAIHRSTGALSRRLDQWTDNLVAIAAIVEAEIDYDGEIIAGEFDCRTMMSALADDIETALRVPPAERLRDGIRVVITGPPNAGKSSLFNAILGSEAAIVSPYAGTTRDVLERPIALSGLPFILIDTAGDRETDEPVERIGVERARRMRAEADIVLDLSADRSIGHLIAVSAKSDTQAVRGSALPVSAISGAGLDDLVTALVALGGRQIPAVGEIALDRRYRTGLRGALTDLKQALQETDPLLIAEFVRTARQHMDGLTGRGGLDEMLDQLFGRFCLGK